MKQFIALALLLSFPIICQAAWVPGPIVEAGKQLPDELLCIRYAGRNGAVIALYAEGCPDMLDGWIYPPKDPGRGTFLWLHNGIMYRFTPLTGAEIQVERKE